MFVNLCLNFVNAGCAEKDMEYLITKADEFKQKGKHVDVSFITTEERALIAVQGECKKFDDKFF